MDLSTSATVLKTTTIMMIGIGLLRWQLWWSGLETKILEHSPFGRVTFELHSPR